MSIHDVLGEDVPHLGYCIAAEEHGLGQCRCNSHPSVWRRDGEAMTPEDWSRWYAAIDRYDESRNRQLRDAGQPTRLWP